MGKSDGLFIETDSALLKEWDFDRNKSVNLTELLSTSGDKFWWLCERGHSWQATLTKRILGFSKCLACQKDNGQKLFDAYPHLFKELDDADSQQFALELSSGSTIKIRWSCSLGHKFEASPEARTRGSSCPYCCNQKVLSGFNDMATTHPELARYLDSEKTGAKAEELSGGSGRKFWWKCDRGHSTQATADSRKKNPSSCPVCSNKLVVTGVNDMATTHPTLSMEFDIEKNFPITPETINAGTRKVLWWKCPEGHNYDMDGMHRVTQNAKCPVCSSKRILAGYNDMETLAPQLLPHFHFEKNHPRTPQNLAYRSNHKLWWICELGHEYRAKPGNRLQDGGLGCPVCSTHQILAGFNDLATTHPELTEEWHPTKNHKTPQQVAGGTNKKAWWVCSEGHEWFAYINLRAKGRNCPRCSKGGFDNTKPGWLYLIENHELRAGKLGISNHKTRRLEEYQSGWKHVHTWHHNSGLAIRATETKILRYIRQELRLPQFLSDQEMGHAGGASETFSNDGLNTLDLISRIDEVLEEMTSPRI